MNAATARLKLWREDPVHFVRDNFGAEPDSWQVEILRAFPNNQRIAMKAAKGCGKSTILAWLAWNFLATRPHPKIAATSITSDNLSDGLWTEMAKWQHRSAFLKEEFEWTKTRIFNRKCPQTWWMSARTWPKSADTSQQADTLAGLHADYLLFILDEVGGIPDAVMVAAEAGLSTGTETKIVIAGNPTHVEGPLYRAATVDRGRWFIKEITGDPDDPNRSSRIDIEWARDQIAKYGKDSPWVLVNVFGRFPPVSINALLGPDDISAATNRHYNEDAYSFAQKRLGIDVARFGDDKTIIFPRQGLVAFKPVEMRNARTNDIAARVVVSKEKFESELEFIDATGGYGAGVADSLIQMGHTPIEVNFSGKPNDSRFFNKRSEIWWNLAEWIKRGGSIPDVPEIGKALTAATYTLHNGKFRVEEKDQIKKRLNGFSPDEVDALALTFSIPEAPAQFKLPGGTFLPLERSEAQRGNIIREGPSDWDGTA